MRLPLGIRNCNPGNIELSQNFQWQGEVRPSRHPRFCTFGEPLSGLRALMKLLINYNQKHGIKTIRGAINRWAPSHENETNLYVDWVSRLAKIPADAEYDFVNREFLIPVTKAITLYENGFPSADNLKDGAHPNWYPDREFEEAYQLAVKGRISSHSMNELKEK